jgi:hypothetical protein
VTVGVPASLDEVLSPEWLTAALGTRYPGIEVTSVERGELISRVATNQAFTIKCADGVPEGLSPHLFAKGYFTEIGEQFRFAGIPESLFYRDIAESTGMHTLRCVYADLDTESFFSVVITEDVAVDGAVFLDSRSDYTADQAAQSLEDLARLHASTWMQPRYAKAEWLASRLEQYTQRRGMPDIAVNFDGPIGAGVPSEVRDTQRLYGTYAALGRQVADEAPWCVVHGDAHIGNVFLDPTGRPSFVDWQLVQRGPWYLDVGYHLSASLSVDDRRADERDLVAHYLEVLAAGGVDVPDETAVWRGVRRGMVHGFYLWAITLKVDPEITTRLLERLGTAVADHDAYAAVTAEEGP